MLSQGLQVHRVASLMPLLRAVNTQDQRGVLRDIMELCNDGAASAVGLRGVMRVDDKLFKLAYLSIFDKY